MPLRRSGPALAILLALLAGGAGATAHPSAPVRGAARPPAVAAVPTGASTTITMRPHESLARALVRGGLSLGDSVRASSALADDFDVVNAHPGQTLRISFAAGARSGAGFASLEFTPRPEERLVLWQGVDGGLRVRREPTPTFRAPVLLSGVVKGSLYLSIVGAGAEPSVANEVVGQFGRRLDLERDVSSGDHFRLVFEEARRADGRPAAPGRLLYADIVTRVGALRLYRSGAADDPTGDWVDGEGDRPDSGLLRTPIDGARLTSGFGPRLHPLLGYTRMHQGLDFGAPVGTPILAAGDGVVEEARWDGDYGRWLRIRHAPGLETGYAHLSAWAPGVTPGAHVRQGQVIAYVGITGLTTGPHLHYEVFEQGHRIDPRDAPTLAPRAPPPGFAAHRASIDATVAEASAACAASPRLVDAMAARCVG